MLLSFAGITLLRRCQWTRRKGNPVGTGVQRTLAGAAVMRVLYGGPLSLGSTCEHRLRAFRRAVCTDVIEFPFEKHLASGNFLFRKLTDRFQFSAALMRINTALLEAVERGKPDWIWLDKPIYFFPETIERLNSIGVITIAYMPDDPYGPRDDGVWRHFKTALPCYWGHVVPRELTRVDYIERGARRVVTVPFAYEPSLHFPPQTLGLRPPKTLDVSFIGSPYDDRAKWITKLVNDIPQLSFGLYGPGWRKHRSLLNSAGIVSNPGVWNDQYREVIWRSRLSLSFVTRANRDESSHKAIEIAASGTATLVEPSPVHNRIFRDQKSAYFFNDPNELSSVVRHALEHANEMEAVAANGARAVRSGGFSNDEVLSYAVAALELRTNKNHGSAREMTV
jgi:hypothetical protein